MSNGRGLKINTNLNIYKNIKLRDNKYDHLINKYSNNFFISSDTPVCKIYMVKVVAFYHCSLH